MTVHDRFQEPTIDAEEGFVLPVFNVDSLDPACSFFHIREREHVTIAGEDEDPSHRHVRNYPSRTGE